jgi:hypothetical protein
MGLRGKSGNNNSSRIFNVRKTCGGSRMSRPLCPPSHNNQPFLPDGCGKSNRRACKGNSKSNRYGGNSNSSRRSNGNGTYEGSNRISRPLKLLSLSNLPDNPGNSNPRTCNGSSKNKRYGSNNNSNSSRICKGNKTCDGSNRICRLPKPL